MPISIKEIPPYNLLNNMSTNSRIHATNARYITRADPGFQVRGAHLKILRRAEGGTKMFGVFRVKNYDFTPKKSYFSNFSGGGGGCVPPGSTPALYNLLNTIFLQAVAIL